MGDQRNTAESRTPRFRSSMVRALQWRLTRCERSPALQLRRDSIVRSFLLTTVLVGGCALWSCHSSGERSSSGGSQSGTGGQSGEGLPPVTAMPPELELEENFRSPVASGRFVWMANPETNRVVLIDARSFEVRVVDGGHGPTFLAALPFEGDDRTGALVLNVFGGDASVFEFSSATSEGMGGAGTSSRAIQASSVDVQHGATAWAVGRTGKFAIAWSQFEEDLRGPLDGYQELTIIDLRGDHPLATKLSAGFRPSQVTINEDETRAYVVSTPGISVIDLTAEPPVVVREILLPTGEGGVSRDISFTPDGSLALVRLNRSSELTVIRTRDDERRAIVLPQEVTDLDLSRDGSLAVAVMRGTSAAGSGGSHDSGHGAMGGHGGSGGHGGDSPHALQQLSKIALLPVPDLFDAPDGYRVLETTELVGSTVLSDDGSQALLFTNAVSNPRLTLLNLENDSVRTVDVTAPIQAAFVSESGRYALVVMSPPPGSQRAGAFAMVDVQDDGPPRIEGTMTVPRFVSLGDDRSLVTTWGSETVPASAFLGKFPVLSVDRVDLASEPLASGLIPGVGQGFVAQAHAEGRVTFFDLDTAEARTVTGFELASEVVD